MPQSIARWRFVGQSRLVEIHVKRCIFISSASIGLLSTTEAGIKCPESLLWSKQYKHHPPTDSYAFDRYEYSARESYEWLINVSFRMKKLLTQTLYVPYRLTIRGLPLLRHGNPFSKTPWFFTFTLSLQNQLLRRPITYLSKEVEHASKFAYNKFKHA